MVEIDGSLGEGGGQIIRTSLSLSALTNIPFLIAGIRNRRPKPGLRAQHLSAVRATQAITGAHVEGDEIGSHKILFEPHGVKGGPFQFDIGTAGATSLVLETLLPPLVFAGSGSRISLRGGTHVPISPPFHFIRDVFLPFLAEMSIQVKTSIKTYGFYPKGGGEIEAEVASLEARPLERAELPENKAIWAVKGISAVANLPLSIAERQKEAALAALRGLALTIDVEARSVSSPGAGTFLFLKAWGGACRAGFTSIGIRGKRAETVGSEAATALLEYWRRPGCVDPLLADQIVLYLALSRGRSSFTTTAITPHLVTNLAVIEKFLHNRYHVEGQNGSPGKVTIDGVGFS